MRHAREIWVQIVRQFEQSELTQEEYASQRGIPVGTLRSWIYRLRREETPLLPVRVIASTAPSARCPDEVGAGIEVELGDPVRLRFPAATPASTIVELVCRLRERC